MNGDIDTIQTRPFVKVFGSAVIRVEPDMASIVVAVYRTEQKPEVAFSKAHEGAKCVTAYLRQMEVNDFGSSRVTLSEDFAYAEGKNKFVGYLAKIEFNVVLRDIDRVDAVDLSGMAA
jgi:uncharacterized protein YggE